VGLFSSWFPKQPSEINLKLPDKPKSKTKVDGLVGQPKSVQTPEPAPADSISVQKNDKYEGPEAKIPTSIEPDESEVKILGPNKMEVKINPADPNLQKQPQQQAEINSNIELSEDKEKNAFNREIDIYKNINNLLLIIKDNFDVIESTETNKNIQIFQRYNQIIKAQEILRLTDDKLFDDLKKYPIEDIKSLQGIIFDLVNEATKNNKLSLDETYSKLLNNIRLNNNIALFDLFIKLAQKFAVVGSNIENPTPIEKIFDEGNETNRKFLQFIEKINELENLKPDNKNIAEIITQAKINALKTLMRLTDDSEPELKHEGGFRFVDYGETDKETSNTLKFIFDIASSNLQLTLQEIYTKIEEFYDAQVNQEQEAAAPTQVMNEQIQGQRDEAAPVQGEQPPMPAVKKIITFDEMAKAQSTQTVNDQIAAQEPQIEDAQTPAQIKPIQEPASAQQVVIDDHTPAQEHQVDDVQTPPLEPMPDQAAEAPVEQIIPEESGQAPETQIPVKTETNPIAVETAEAVETSQKFDDSLKYFEELKDKARNPETPINDELQKTENESIGNLSRIVLHNIHLFGKGEFGIMKRSSEIVEKLIATYKDDSPEYKQTYEPLISQKLGINFIHFVQNEYNNNPDKFEDALHLLSFINLENNFDEKIETNEYARKIYLSFIYNFFADEYGHILLSQRDELAKLLDTKGGKKLISESLDAMVANEKVKQNIENVLDRIYTVEQFVKDDSNPTLSNYKKSLAHLYAGLHHIQFDINDEPIQKFEDLKNNSPEGLVYNLLVDDDYNSATPEKIHEDLKTLIDGWSFMLEKQESSPVDVAQELKKRYETSKQDLPTRQETEASKEKAKQVEEFAKVITYLEKFDYSDVKNNPKLNHLFGLLNEVKANQEYLKDNPDKSLDNPFQGNNKIVYGRILSKLEETK
jgi:hypothetical protein